MYYGSIVYGSTRASYIKCLDPIHNQGLRLCLGAFRTSPMESLYVVANEESLYKRRERLSIHYALKSNSKHTYAHPSNSIQRHQAWVTIIRTLGATNSHNITSDFSHAYLWTSFRST